MLPNSSSTTRLKKAGELVFTPPVTALSLMYYGAPDGGLTTTYEKELSRCEATGEHGKRSAYLTGGQLPKEYLAQEAVEIGTSKPRAKMPNAPAVLDPKIRRLMREVNETDPSKLKVAMDPKFVQDIRRANKVDHITGIFSVPKQPQDGLTIKQSDHLDFVSKLPPPDKKHFLKKNVNSEYVEALVKQEALRSKAG
eukprot:TRINITY_DN97072_c0_g1_i1.p1 TRINITY_DN97072_c0_g1~~TRINITY_DN97072_c0_g1_i1.p1  ORF type:complete len:196 (+),score=33.92 TRINITY_DN97072_c0_g1_i1:120-707(+)